MKNIIENNKFIAEFMGCIFEVIILFEDDNKVTNVPQNKWSRPEWMTDELYNLYGWVSYQNEKHMLYNSSWDWLMPVVEKIENLTHLDNGFWIYRNVCECSNINIETTKGISKIDATYKTVVKFIKWYNKTNKS